MINENRRYCLVGILLDGSTTTIEDYDTKEELLEVYKLAKETGRYKPQFEDEDKYINLSEEYIDIAMDIEVIGSNGFHSRFEPLKEIQNEIK